MNNTVSLLQLIHKITLSILLILIATIPLIIKIDIRTAFVILPSLLIVIFTLSIIIEQKLLLLTLKTKPTKTRNRCLISKCLYKNCLG